MQLKVANPLNRVKSSSSLSYSIVSNACERPFFKILENAGLDSDTIFSIESDIKENGNEWDGYNPRIDEIVNMFVKERYLKKDLLAKKSKMVGEILNAQNIAKYCRDYSLKLNGNDLLEKILSPIWTTESYE